VRVGPYSKLTEALEAAREIETKSGFRAIILPAAPGNQTGQIPG
jgi:hypothetical protein